MHELKCTCCNQLLFELKSGKSPFKPNAKEIEINIKCPRCSEEMSIKLI